MELLSAEPQAVAKYVLFGFKLAQLGVEIKPRSTYLVADVTTIVGACTLNLKRML